VTKPVLDVRVNPGSNGPVFEAHSGKVLGLVSAEGLRDPPNLPKEFEGLFEIPSGMAYCIPLAPILEAISALRSVPSVETPTDSSGYPRG